MGRMVLRADGYYWYEEDPEHEVRFAPYEREPSADDWRCYHEPSRSWEDHIRHCPPHISFVRPQRQLTDDEYAAILSVLSGQTVEEWKAQRLAEGKPISPVGEEKED